MRRMQTTTNNMCVSVANQKEIAMTSDELAPPGRLERDVRKHWLVQKNQEIDKARMSFEWAQLDRNGDYYGGNYN